MNVFSCTQSQRASASVGIDDVLFNTFKTPSIDVQLRWTGEDDQPQLPIFHELHGFKAE